MTDSGIVVTVGAPGLCALMDAINAADAAVRAITPTAGDDVQSEAVLEARKRTLAALRAVQAMNVGAVHRLPA